MCVKYPYYRLFERKNEFLIDCVLAAVDLDNPHYDPEDPWTHSIKSKEVARVKTRESAMAVLRLVCSKYMAWADQGAWGATGWDSPMVTI